MDPDSDAEEGPRWHSKYLHGLECQRQFRETGQLAYLHQALQLGLEAMQYISEQHDFYQRYCNFLETVAESIYNVTDRLEDLDQTIHYGQLALEIPEDSLQHYHSVNLGTKFQQRFRMTNQIADLRQSIQYTERAVELLPKTHPDLAEYLDTLAMSLLFIYNGTSQQVDLERAAKYMAHAMTSLWKRTGSV